MRGKEDCTRKVRILRFLRNDGSFWSVIICTTSNQKRIVSYYNLFICVEDKNFNLIILLDAHIRLLDFDTLIKRSPKPFIPDYLNKQ
jgi:hypothetical protein